jgi:hypothetical protein
VRSLVALTAVGCAPAWFGNDAACVASTTLRGGSIDLVGFDTDCIVASDQPIRVRDDHALVEGDRIGVEVAEMPLAVLWEDHAWVDLPTLHVDAVGFGELALAPSDDLAAVTCASCVVRRQGDLAVVAEQADLTVCGTLTGRLDRGLVQWTPTPDLIVPVGDRTLLTGFDLEVGPGVQLEVGLPASLGDRVEGLPAGAVRVSREACGDPSSPYVPGGPLFFPQNIREDWNGAIEVFPGTDGTPIDSLAVYTSNGTPIGGRQADIAGARVFQPWVPFTPGGQVFVVASREPLPAADHTFSVPDTTADPRPAISAYTFSMGNARILQGNDGNVDLSDVSVTIGELVASVRQDDTCIVRPVSWTGNAVVIGGQDGGFRLSALRIGDRLERAVLDLGRNDEALVVDGLVGTRAAVIDEVCADQSEVR